MPKRKTILLSILIIFVCSAVFFALGLQFPVKQNFDEFHYVPAAKAFLSGMESQNWEHPPLGKWIMALGIGWLGDQPSGWRIMSVVFGALTLVGMYLWALVLFKKQREAILLTLLTLSNQLLYVQARIGMLDTFMFGFSVFACAGLSWIWLYPLERSKKLKLAYGVGILFGLGIACKWSAIVPWVLVLGLMALSYKKFLKEFTFTHLFGAFVLTPVLVYFSTFLPFLFLKTQTPYSLLDLFSMQYKMYEGQLRVLGQHPYHSHWSQWPLLNRPIWYAFDREGDQNEWVRGVLLIGNPLIMWAGLGALLVTLWSWIKTKNQTAYLIVMFYAAFYFAWVLIPRKVSFYYYYYPAGMVLSFALVYAFEFYKMQKLRWTFLGASILMFIYFFPILSAQKIPADSFIRWMWFRSWI